MKIRLLTILILSIIILTACGGPNVNEVKEAWDACQNATGTPTEKKVTGYVYSVSKHDEGADGFGGRGGTGYRIYTDDLSQASAVLCEEILTVENERKTCKYDGGFRLYIYSVKVEISLISWPSKEIIAQKSIYASFDGPCSEYYVHNEDEKEHRSYAGYQIDDWLNLYITVPEE